jgi:multidrug efflux system membrane fusion protein
VTIFDLGKTTHRPIERWMSVAIIGSAILLGLLVIWRAGHHPRTDDAEVFANLIGIAPQVEGPIVELHVQDNQFVKKGDLLYVIDPRPYQYALENALAAKDALEGQINDEQRKIAAQVSGVSVAKAGIQTAEADVQHWAAVVDQARADVVNAEQGASAGVCLEPHRRLPSGGMDLRCGPPLDRIVTQVAAELRRPQHAAAG